MNPATIATIAGAAALLIVVSTLLAVRWHRRRAQLANALANCGWTRRRDGESTLVQPGQPGTDDWLVRTTRSFASQQSPPSTHIVVSTWTSAWPRRADGAMVAGPTPPGPLRDLAIQLIGSLNGPMRGWLGLARIGGGADLTPLRSADSRLLVLSTDETEVTGLSGVADAVCTWCERYRDERDQPAVTLDADGGSVRVRTDVTTAAPRLLAFVELGLACRAALADRNR